MSSEARAEIGRAGEDAALRLYRELGYRTIARNWRCALGELDLIVERVGVLVFCEVKTRTGSSFGGGFAAVTGAKQRKVRVLAEAFLSSGRVSPAAVRLDVASAHRHAGGDVSVELFEDAF